MINGSVDTVSRAVSVQQGNIKDAKSCRPNALQNVSCTRQHGMFTWCLLEGNIMDATWYRKKCTPARTIDNQLYMQEEHRPGGPLLGACSRATSWTCIIVQVECTPALNVSYTRQEKDLHFGQFTCNAFGFVTACIFTQEEEVGMGMGMGGLLGACSEEVEQHAVCLDGTVYVHLLLSDYGTSVHGLHSVQQSHPAFSGSLLQQRQDLSVCSFSRYQ